jgi:2-oxoglutarate dehydrogenase E1 component
MATHPDLDSLFNGANAVYLAELLDRYRADPASVDPSWHALFREMATEGTGYFVPGWGREKTKVIGVPDPAAVAPAKGKGTNGAAAPVAAPAAGSVSIEQARAATLDSIRAIMLIRAYRVRGHLDANLDPLGLTKREPHPELDPASYGFTEADMDRPIFIDNVLGMHTATLREIIAAVKKTYCGSIGVEFMHITDPEQKSWIQQRIEGPRNQTDFTERGKRAILERLTAAEGFERFLDKKFVGTKRFGLDGAESAVPALEQIIKRGGQLGVREIVIGMPHRGRLNVLANVMGKPYVAIFSEFQGVSSQPDDVQGSGDVKYHLGTSSDREFDGNKVHLSLTANPSHLEAVNPVVLGKARAKSVQLGDSDRTQVMPLLLHGDAAFAGQGIVPETMSFVDILGYRTGGTIHFIVNNQIGFTTAPAYSRSGAYYSDIAKGLGFPVFHVNGDDPEAVVHVARIAVEFRQRFHRDVVIDMFCYRRHGHNEADEPSFTQPIMYRKIASQPTTRTIYAEHLAKTGQLAAEESQKIYDDFAAHLESQFEASKNYKPNKADWLEGKWAGIELAKAEDNRGNTAVPMELLKEVGEGICRVPDGHNIHRTIRRQLDNKKKLFDAGGPIDWATGEALAFGTLAVEGTPVRLSGQDCGRGTFSQRHSVLVDQETEKRHVPLNSIRPKQATFEVHDSPLSEFGVLGFEYGYSMAEPNALVLWEAQFGDFANGAQTMFDQFISSAEVKWLRMSGLVMLLPHGYEGQGPEHSSARLERFLQMCAEDNWQVCNLTTPANYFHALRRQVRRTIRKPLLIMTPKSLLRHKLAVSPLADFGPGTSFHRILPETEKIAADGKVKRVVLCSGKIYYDLFEERAKRGIDDVALVRIEQLYPFPLATTERELGRYKNAEIVWCQEEPQNMGAWTFVEHRLENILANLKIAAKRPAYVGRPEAAATATGLYKRHNKQQADIVEKALTV